MIETIRTTSIRVALKDLRAEIEASEHAARDTGHHSRAVALDDGTWLSVELVPAFGGGVLMGVYQATRIDVGGSRGVTYQLGKAGVSVSS